MERRECSASIRKTPDACQPCFQKKWPEKDWDVFWMITLEKEKSLSS